MVKNSAGVARPAEAPSLPERPEIAEPQERALVEHGGRVDDVRDASRRWSRGRRSPLCPSSCSRRPPGRFAAGGRRHAGRQGDQPEDIASADHAVMPDNGAVSLSPPEPSDGRVTPMELAIEMSTLVGLVLSSDNT